MRLLAHLGVAAASLGLAGIACGTSDGRLGSSSGAAGSGATSGFGGTSSGVTPSSGSSGASALYVPDAGFPIVVSGPSIDGGGPDAFVGCAMSTVQAKLLPLDLYFMVDTSFSMDDLVESGKSKWQAVSAAIAEFVGDPASAGLEVGLQYFPNTVPGIPSSCSSSAQCKTSGPCVLNTCLVPTNQVIPCDTDTDCQLCDAFGRCQEYSCVSTGSCANAHDVFCSPGTPCGLDSNGFDLGTCETLTSSFCSGNDDCVSTDYQAPAVSIAALPGNAAAITASLMARQPLGNTPTQAALQGALAGAEAWASTHAGHTVVVVLATDGQPDEIADNTGQCASPQSAQSAATQVGTAASAGVNANPSVKTFGIGVFTPSDIASGTAALNAIATAGGTTQPFIINTTGGTTDIENQFTAALTAIRGTSLPCNYMVPTPTSGSPNFSEINVQFTAGSGAATTVPYVQKQANCDAKVGGWYYNTDPAAGGAPTSIEICPSSCTEFKSDAAGRVDIVLGCQTEGIAR
jgi:hypothetical protein